MLQYIVRRMLLMIPLLLGVVTFAFLIMHATPGSPAERILGEYATAEAIAELEHRLGLDRPLHIQYINFIWKYLQGDFGSSLRNRRPVREEILKVLPYTFELAVAGLLVSIALGLGIGIISAIKPNSLIDNISRIIALLGVSMPVFWSAMLLIIAFSIHLRWFPVLGAGDRGNPLDLLHHLVLPALAVGSVSAALTMRMSRSSMLDILHEDYIRTAFAKGLPPRHVYVKHALKNASIPIVTVIGLNFGYLMGGAVLTETVFSRPGLGKLLVDSVLWRDYPVVQGSIFVFSLMFLLINLIVDITYAFLNPRIRLE